MGVLEAGMIIGNILPCTSDKTLQYSLVHNSGALMLTSVGSADSASLLVLHGVPGNIQTGHLSSPKPRNCKYSICPCSLNNTTCFESEQEVNTENVTCFQQVTVGRCSLTKGEMSSLERMHYYMGILCKQDLNPKP